jgi:hypothetical protein
MKKVVSAEIWNKFISVGERQGPVKLNDLALEMNLDPEETLSFMREIFTVGVGLDIYHENNECWLDFKSDSVQYMLPLTPSEWIHLHQILSCFKASESPVTSSLKKKVNESGPIKIVMELLSHLERWDCEISELQQTLVRDLEQGIVEKHLIKLTRLDGKSHLIHPCKVIHLEGQLSLIGEDSMDHCLLVVPLKNIKSIETVGKDSISKVSHYELEEFITAIRSMNERETRLILKIYDHQSINLFPDHHFLGKPCMVTNPNGDLIWAAYVEPCESLYEWMISLGENVEILDPLNFKKEFITYCEEKLKKVA